MGNLCSSGVERRPSQEKKGDDKILQDKPLLKPEAGDVLEGDGAEKPLLGLSDITADINAESIIKGESEDIGKRASTGLSSGLGLFSSTADEVISSTKGAALGSQRAVDSVKSSLDEVQTSTGKRLSDTKNLVSQQIDNANNCASETSARASTTLLEAKTSALGNVDSISSTVSNEAGKLKATAEEKTNEISLAGKATIDSATEALSGKVDEVMSSFSSNVEEVSTLATGKLGELGKSANTAADSVTRNVDETSSKLNEAKTAAEEKSSSAVGTVQNTVHGKAEEISRLVREEGAEITANVSGKATELENSAAAKVKEISDTLDQQVDAAKAAVSEKVEAMRTSFAEATATGKAQVDNLLQGASSSFDNETSKVQAAAVEVSNQNLDTFEKAGEAVRADFTSGSSLMDALPPVSKEAEDATTEDWSKEAVQAIYAAGDSVAQAADNLDTAFEEPAYPNLETDAMVFEDGSFDAVEQAVNEFSQAAADFPPGDLVFEGTDLVGECYGLGQKRTSSLDALLDDTEELSDSLDALADQAQDQLGDEASDLVDFSENHVERSETELPLHAATTISHPAETGWDLGNALSSAPPTLTITSPDTSTPDSDFLSQLPHEEEISSPEEGDAVPAPPEPAEDEETMQRIAAQVTAEAVEEAMRIVARDSEDKENSNHPGEEEDAYPPPQVSPIVSSDSSATEGMSEDDIDAGLSHHHLKTTPMPADLDMGADQADVLSARPPPTEAVVTDNHIDENSAPIPVGALPSHSLSGENISDQNSTPAEASQQFVNESDADGEVTAALPVSKAVYQAAAGAEVNGDADDPNTVPGLVEVSREAVI